MDRGCVTIAVADELYGCMYVCIYPDSPSQLASPYLTSPGRPWQARRNMYCKENNNMLELAADYPPQVAS